MKPELDLIKILFFLLIITPLLNAQIPINGFCKYREFQVNQNNSKIFAVDYNNDGWRDLLLFNQSDKRFSAQRWNKNKFSPSVKSYSSSLYDLKQFSSDQRGKRIAYISRKDREAGIFTLTKNGSPSSQSKIKFDTYPSSIDAMDIDRDNKPEILISGNSFNGISILKESGKILKEKKVSNNRLYSFTRFIDLDYDGYYDISAIDLLSNSIILFNNDRSGNFRESRSIRLEINASQLSAIDVNSDDFTDLIYISEKRFEILLGDSVSSFQKRMTINCEVTPDQYTLLDFNADGYNDIAFINRENGFLYIMFARDQNSFYAPILYFQKSGLADVTSFIDRDGRKLCALDNNGKVFLIEVINQSSSNFDIALGIKPSLVGTFNLYNDNLKDLFFVDDETNKLRMLVSNRRKFYDSFYEYSILQKHKNVLVDETRKFIKTFYFYSTGQSIIELLRIDFVKNEFTRRVLYADGPIEVLKITSDRLKDRQTIFLLINKNQKLSLQSFDFRDFRYVSSGLNSLASSVVAASLTFGVYKEIFYFDENINTYWLKQSVFNRRIASEAKLLRIKVNDGFSTQIQLKSFEDENINENITLACVTQRNDSEIYLINRKDQYKMDLSNFTPNPDMFCYLDGTNENKLYMYDKRSGILKSLIISTRNFDHRISNVFESKTINSYIVDRLINKKEYLIYSDFSDNLIKFNIIR